MNRRRVVVITVAVAGAASWVIAVSPSSHEDKARQTSAVDNTQPTAAVAPPPQPKPALAAPAAANAIKEPAAPDPNPDPGETAAELANRVMFSKDEGPVAELRQTFEAEPRDSAASSIEETIRTAFNKQDTPAGLLASVLCRQTVCRLEVRWSPERTGSYIAGVTRASQSFEHDIGVSAAATPQADHLRTLEVYMKRRPSSAEQH